MGIIEAIQEELKKQAWEEGLQKGREKGLQEGCEEERVAVQTTIVSNLLKKGFTVEFITDVTGVEEARVLDIKAQLEADGEL